jgi:hypothetical protein
VGSGGALLVRALDGLRQERDGQQVAVPQLQAVECEPNDPRPLVIQREMQMEADSHLMPFHGERGRWQRLGQRNAQGSHRSSEAVVVAGLAGTATARSCSSPRTARGSSDRLSTWGEAK